MVYGHVPGRAAIRARLVRFNELQILAQNVRPRLFAVAQLAKSLFDKTVIFFLRRRGVAPIHRAFGVFVKNHVL